MVFASFTLLSYSSNQVILKIMFIKHISQKCKKNRWKLNEHRKTGLIPGDCQWQDRWHCLCKVVWVTRRWVDTDGWQLLHPTRRLQCQLLLIKLHRAPRENGRRKLQLWCHPIVHSVGVTAKWTKLLAIRTRCDVLSHLLVLRLCVTEHYQFQWQLEKYV